MDMIHNKMDDEEILVNIRKMHKAMPEVIMSVKEYQKLKRDYEKNKKNMHILDHKAGRYFIKTTLFRYYFVAFFIWSAVLSIVMFCAIMYNISIAWISLPIYFMIYYFYEMATSDTLHIECYL